MNQRKKKPVPKNNPARRDAQRSVPMPPVTKQSPAVKPLTFSVILGVLAVILYANTAGHNYALDDIAVIYQNKFTTQGLKGIPKMVTTFYWEGYWNFNSGLYRPLSLILFAVEWQFFPNNAHLAHVVNILLYAAVVVTLFLLLKNLMKGYSIYVPFVCCLLFVANPLHTEVVANIKSGDELLCLLFFIIAAFHLLEFIKTKKRIHLILSPVAYFLCLFSKEGGLAYLAVFPLLLYFFRNLSLKDSLMKTWIYVLPAGIFLLLHSYVIGHDANQRITYTYLDNALVAAPDAASRLATAIYMAGDYLKLLVYPHPLSYDYSYNQIPATTFGSPQVIFTVIVFGVLIFFAVKKFKEKSIYSFAILFYLITMAMVSNIFTLIGATFAVRFLFVPSLAFCLVLAVAGNKFLSGKTFLALASIICLLYSARTIARNTDWKDNFTLFKADVKAAPGSARVHYNYGTAYLDSIAMKPKELQDRKELMPPAIHEFEEALSIDPKAQDAAHNLAIAYYHSGNYAQSIQAGLTSIKYNPDNASTLSNLGNAYYRNNEFDKAIDALNKSITMGLVSDDTYNFLGSSYFSKRDYKTAVEMFNKALQKKPDQADVLNNLASAYGSMGDYDNAIVTFKKSAELNPNNPQTWYFIGLTYQNKGDAANAKLYFDKANSLTKK